MDDAGLPGSLEGREYWGSEMMAEGRGGFARRGVCRLRLSSVVCRVWRRLSFYLSVVCLSARLEDRDS